MKSTLHRALVLSLYLVAFSLLGYFAWQGLPYYLTPIAERPRHPLYWDYKPGGRMGLLFGITGASMMVLMLLYSVRKRLPFARRFGPVASWLDYHIFLGIGGPLFILLHCSFKVQGLVALSFWSMIAVALSGIAGRFLYRQIPRSSAGDELSRGEVEAGDRDLTRRLSSEYGLSDEALARLDEIANASAAPDASLLRLALGLPFDLWTMRRRLRSFRRQHLAPAGAPGATPSADRHRFEQMVGAKVKIHRRLALWQRVRELFHYWHVFHKPFAVIMYLFMAVHIGVAWMTGYGWVGH